MKHVTDYFTSHPASNEVFETSDGFLFHKDGDATLHAKTLENKEVTLHTRSMAMKVEDEVITEPVITEIQKHEVPTSDETNTGALIPAESIQPPVSADVKEEIAVVTTATGEPVTSTAAEVNTPSTNQMPQQVNSVPVNTASGEVVANATAVTKAKKTAAEKKAAAPKK